MPFAFLDRDRSIAPPGYSRWLVPPAALAIHLSIGQVYAFSVFKNPLLALHGADGTAWNLKEVGYIFSIAIAFLGISAALFGAWLEKAGPRRAMFYAASASALAFIIAALGASLHSLALIYLGYGVIGGIGLGLGYISPVSTLIKWFPDRPGLSTGLAIMGFGGGAMIGGPLASNLMAYFKPRPALIPYTMITMGALYFLFMMFGVFTIRVPQDGWKPEGWTPPVSTPHSSPPTTSTSIMPGNPAVLAPLGHPLHQRHRRHRHPRASLAHDPGPLQIQHRPAAAVGFVGLLSIFNMAGRFFWASVSDFIGRKATYFIFFTLGAILYYVLPFTREDKLNSVPLFVGIAVVLLSMYGGGFATIPAYLKDLFGGFNVSAIHGRLLTAWSAPESSARSSSTASSTTTSQQATQSRTPTHSSCTSCPACSSSASLPICSSEPSTKNTGSKTKTSPSPQEQHTNPRIRSRSWPKPP